MGRRISMATRIELLQVLRCRYRSSTRREKGRILDEFVAISGYHRKHAIRLLNQTPTGRGTCAGSMTRECAKHS